MVHSAGLRRGDVRGASFQLGLPGLPGGPREQSGKRMERRAEEVCREGRPGPEGRGGVGRATTKSPKSVTQQAWGALDMIQEAQ